MMKIGNIKHTLLVGLAVTVVGCYDLEQPNPNLPTESSFWKTEDQLYQGLVATYDQLQSGIMWAQQVRVFTTLLSDEGTNEAPFEFNALARFTLDDINFAIDLWLGHYELIGRAYQVIDRAPEIDGAGVPRIEAEAKFFVAYGYYNLISFFGENISYVDEIQAAADRPRAAIDGELWALAEQYLQEAIPELPLAGEISPSEYGRITRGAAQALLGKVHMQQSEYGEAEPYLRDVIESGQYQLNDNFEDNFTELNFVNPEAVFVVNFRHNGVTAETDNRVDFRLFSLAEAKGAFGDVQSTNFIVDEFLQENDVDGNQDPRLNATIFWEGSDRLYYGETHAWWMENTGVFNPDVNTAYYKYSEQAAVADNDNGNNIINDVDGGTDHIVIRYADVLLSYAECLNETGSGDPYPYVDIVRTRSNMEPLSDANPGLGQDAFREQLKHERLLELAGEAVRFFDLKRWGDYGPSSADNDPNFETFSIGQDEVFPIPQEELDLNPNLSQNPGY